MRPTAFRATCILVLTLALAACGLKSDLFLPAEAPPMPAGPAATPGDAEADPAQASDAADPATGAAPDRRSPPTPRREQAQ